MNISLSLKSKIRHYAKMFHALFPEGFSIDGARTVDIGGRTTPILKHGHTDLNLNYTATDSFTQQTGMTTTVFVKLGDDFIRVSTSIKNQSGERAVGTPLDRAHPGYPKLIVGESYLGLSSLFGKQLMTQYDPIKDASGKVIGAIVTGMGVDSRFYDSLSIKLTAAITLAVTCVFCLYTWALGNANSALVMQGKADNSADKLATELGAIHMQYMGIGIITMLVLAGILYVSIRNFISTPLMNAREAADKLAAGDLTTLIHVDRRDEIGQVMHAINATGQGLARIVGEVRQGSDQITLASREIAAGNADLSSRTESQASSLEETASSMEELTSIVKQNSDNAREVNGHVVSAAEVAERGGNVVGKVVNTMESIKQSSLRIADIISVIDGIAFQTNILALNAAVEAARAGEHGRGFAVVAAEVRNLAQRSATAAKEIKSLIDDSVSNVDTGGKLVEEAGRTMAEIVSSVKRVTAVVMEITSASQEQSTGIEEINNAITHMDEMTQQNAALVEQASAAAQSMYDQAVKLSGAVGIFKLAGGNAPPSIQAKANVAAIGQATSNLKTLAPKASRIAVQGSGRRTSTRLKAVPNSQR
jgi:methyl-accepting chemotaxis protein